MAARTPSSNSRSTFSAVSALPGEKRPSGEYIGMLLRIELMKIGMLPSAYSGGIALAISSAEWLAIHFRPRTKALVSACTVFGWFLA